MVIQLVSGFIIAVEQSAKENSSWCWFEGYLWLLATFVFDSSILLFHYGISK